jgi:hypothetical protein
MLAEAYNQLKDMPAVAPPSGAAAGFAPPPAPPIQIQLDNAPEARSGTNKSAEEWFKDAKSAAEAKAPERALGLIQYAIRLDGGHAEFHALHAKLLNTTKGDKRTLVRSLETALKLDPRDVDSTILLAETFQSLGMHARASRLWNVVHNLAPNHAIFSPLGANAAAKGKNNEKPGMGEQFASLVANAKEAFNRIFKRG